MSFRAITSAIALAWSPIPAMAAYQFTTYDVAGSSSTEIYGINASGALSGTYVTNGVSHGFLLSADGKTLTTIDAPAGGNTNVAGINDLGQVVGYDSKGAGFIRNADGSFTSFVAGTSGSGTVYETYASGINDSGQVVGTESYSGPASSGEFGFIRGANGTISVFNHSQTSGGETSLGGINTSGQSVGGTSGAANQGFIRNVDGSFTNLGSYGAATGINDLGQVVGIQAGSSGLLSEESYLRSADGSSYTLLDVPGSQVTSAYGINDSGVIVGNYEDSSGHDHGFIASQSVVPEPASLLALIEGSSLLGIVAFIRSRRRR